LVCLFKNKKLLKTFTAPVKKGVLAVAFSPDGKKAACAGMDDDHEVSVLDLVSFKVLFTVKGTKKIITKIVWLSNSQFASIGISHYKLWTIDKSLTGK
jgi:WD40 repeat protein